MVSVLCRAGERGQVVAAIFKHTTTIGVREITCRRYVLSRRDEAVPAPDGGTVRRKISEGYGVVRSKFEYEDVARVARSLGVSIREAEAAIAAQ